MTNHVIITESAGNIKAVARQTLKGHWFTAIWIMLINIAIAMVPVVIIQELIKNDNIIVLVQCYSYFVTGPLNLGLSIFFLKMFRGEKADHHDLLSGFNYFRNAFGLYISVIVREVLWTFLFVIPGIVAMFRYSMAFFVLADHPDYTPSQCIAESCRLMDGNKDRLFRIILSFAGWFILASIPRCAVELYLGGLMTPGEEMFRAIVDTLALGPAHWQGLAAGAALILVEIYLNVSECCFYDMLNENVVFKVYEQESEEPVPEIQAQPEYEYIEMTEDKKDEND